MISSQSVLNQPECESFLLVNDFAQMDRIVALYACPCKRFSREWLQQIILSLSLRPSVRPFLSLSCYVWNSHNRKQYPMELKVVSSPIQFRLCSRGSDTLSHFVPTKTHWSTTVDFLLWATHVECVHMDRHSYTRYVLLLSIYRLFLIHTTYSNFGTSADSGTAILTHKPGSDRIICLGNLVSTRVHCLLNRFAVHAS